MCSKMQLIKAFIAVVEINSNYELYKYTIATISNFFENLKVEIFI
jgi:hypothetical protein